MNQFNKEWGNGVNVCDYSHDTSAEIRRLPTSGDSAVLICYKHYLHEMQFRRERNRELVAGGNPQNIFDLPAWNSLEIYSAKNGLGISYKVTFYGEYDHKKQSCYFSEYRDAENMLNANGDLSMPHSIETIVKE